MLASRGIASRRKCDELIKQGRISVDGKVVREMGVMVDPAQQDVACDGESLQRVKKVVLAFYKPKGAVCTHDQRDEGRRVIDLLPSFHGLRLFTVGRLDRDSEGLILVTNDGDYAERVAHPRYQVSKRYEVTIDGRLPEGWKEHLQRGVYLAEGRVKFSDWRIVVSTRGITMLEIELTEGRNREIRRVLASLGVKVRMLRRIAIGKLKVGELRPGRYRALSEEEREAVLTPASPAPARTPR